jgi:predicted glycosyltransferase
MRIWIDLANSPQVLVFNPIAAELKRLGHDIVVTSRHFAQTVPLCDFFKLQHVPIGVHGGKKLSKIGIQILNRTRLLVRFAQKYNFDLAVSHNSYSQALAALFLRVPFVTLMDYEFQPANHLCFRVARQVIVPSFFPGWALNKYGAIPKNTFFYNGLKEEIYLSDFIPSNKLLSTLGIPSQKVIAVVRPPGSWGLYHHFENPLFDDVLTYLLSHKEIFVVLLPRIAAQAENAIIKNSKNVFIPLNAVNGPDLLYNADLVISGGGTMNREAAILGVPTYSIFKGKLAAVDQFLIDSGRMKHITKKQDINTIQIKKKKSNKFFKSHFLVKDIAHYIISAKEC